MQRFTVKCEKCGAKQTISELQRNMQIKCTACNKTFIAWGTSTKPIQNSPPLLILLGIGGLLIIGFLLYAFRQTLFNS